MERYYNPVVMLEEDRASKPENSGVDMSDGMLEFLLGDTGLVDLTLISLPYEDETEADEQEKSEPRFFTVDISRKFCFLPSWYNVYYDLKEDNPERARRYLERLIDFGVLGVEPPRDSPEDRLIYSLLDGPMNVIDKDYRKYLDVIADDKRKKDEAKAKELFEKNERQARKKRYG